jgi:ATP-dependent DNA helicase RecG
MPSDYAVKGVFITIAIFDNRIEFTNPGSLPFGLTLKQALNGSSKIRNRVIGKVFRELKLIEQWGSGLRRIIDACRQRGLKSPDFEELNNQFRVTLYSTPVTERILLPWQDQIIDYLQTHGKITTKEAASLLQVTSRTARERLKSLVELGLIKKVGTSAKDPYSLHILI